MIKIIKPGTKKIAVCKNCGCEFSYETEDINRAETEEIIFGIKSMCKGTYVICPQCANGVVLTSELTK